MANRQKADLEQSSVEQSDWLLRQVLCRFGKMEPRFFLLELQVSNTRFLLGSKNFAIRDRFFVPTIKAGYASTCV